jgi:hypothetical protein
MIDRGHIARRDAVVVSLAGRSLLVRMTDRAVSSVERAVITSRVFEAAGPAIAVWRGAPRPVRLHWLGVMLTTAAAVHLMLAAWRAPADWRWLLLPVLAAVQGVVLMVMSGSRRR